jgi:hypothetical protein
VLEADGKKFRDLPELLAPRQESAFSWADAAAAAGAAAQEAADEERRRQEEREANEWWERRERERREERERRKAARQEQARRKAEWEQKHADELAPIIKKYGSKHAALENDERQTTVNIAAVRLWEPRGTLDGWKRNAPNMPEHVAKAIRAALPFPSTLKQARAELSYWRQRDRELVLMHGEHAEETYLSLPCAAREQLVRAFIKDKHR